MLTLGHIIKEERRKNNLSIKGLASLLGIDYTYVSKIESNKAIPSEDLVKKLCNLYHVNEEEMMIRSGRFPNDVRQIFIENPAEACSLVRKKLSRKFFDPFTNTWYYIPENNFQDHKTNNLQIISLFTGVGGLDIGLEDAGFHISACIEIDKDCWGTIRLNRNWPIMTTGNGDITQITTKQILEFAGLKEGEAALVVGGVPCQPFSNIGKREGVDDRKEGGLFQEFVRVVSEAQPAGFIYENVEGLLHKKHEMVIAYMKKELTAAGYAVNVALLNAADYGVPQRRRRVFVIGRRDNVKPGVPFPKFAEAPVKVDKKYEEIGITLPWKLKKWITVMEVFEKVESKMFLRPDCLTMRISDKVRERMAYIKGNMNFKDLPDHVKPNCWKSGKHQGADTFGRLQLDKPAVTIRTCAYNPSKGRYIHPTENRGLNTMEMALLQSFPKDWRFYGPLVSVGRQIGNAVPPVLAEEIGRVMYEQVLDALNI